VARPCGDGDGRVAPSLQPFGLEGGGVVMSGGETAGAASALGRRGGRQGGSGAWRHIGVRAAAGGGLVTGGGKRREAGPAGLAGR
jgi:hypothetical protein